MWLLFFDRSEHSATAYFESRDQPGMVAQTAYTYVPFLLVAGIVLTAVADELVLQHPSGETEPWTAGLICGAAAVYLLGNALFRRATGGRWSVPHLVGRRRGARRVRAAGTRLTPLTLSWVANAVLLAVIVGDVLLERRAGRTANSPNPEPGPQDRALVKRRRWDLNPRKACPFTTLAGSRTRPGYATSPGQHRVPVRTLDHQSGL